MDILKKLDSGNWQKKIELSVQDLIQLSWEKQCPTMETVSQETGKWDPENNLSIAGWM